MNTIAMFDKLNANLKKVNKIQEKNIELIDKGLRNIKKEIEAKNPGIIIDFIFSRAFNQQRGHIIVQGKSMNLSAKDAYNFNEINKNYETLRDFAIQWNLVKELNLLEDAKFLYDYYFKENNSNQVFIQINTAIPSKYKYLEPKFEPKLNNERYVWEIKKAIENFLLPKSVFVSRNFEEDHIDFEVFQLYVDTLLLFNNKKLLPKKQQIEKLFNELVKLKIITDNMNSNDLMVTGMFENVIFDKKFNVKNVELFSDIFSELFSELDNKKVNIPELITKIKKSKNPKKEFSFLNTDLLEKIKKLDLSWANGNQVISCVEKNTETEKITKNFNLEFFLEK